MKLEIYLYQTDAVDFYELWYPIDWQELVKCPISIMSILVTPLLMLITCLVASTPVFYQMSRLSQRNWLYCGYGEFIEHAAGHIFYADKLDGCHSSIEGGQDDLYQHCVQAGVNNCHDHRYHLVDL